MSTEPTPGTGPGKRTIRTAVAGFGLSGSVFHAPLIAANPAYSLDVISTSDAGRRAAASGSYPGVRVVDTPAEILALAGELDLLVLGTPPATHYPLAKAALEAGLDVVVDKPFTVRSAEGQELIELAARLGTGAHRLPEPALGRRLPDSEGTARQRCAGQRHAVRVAV